MPPYAENVIDPGLGNTVHYYLRADVSLGGSPVDPCTNEDTANDADATGLDNDGDGVRDALDPDCAANTPPVAVDDAYTTDEDTPLNVVAPGVLGNDSDADGDPLTAILNTGVSNGTLTLNADGSFDYTPNANPISPP
jgi:hypothetical protein